LQNADEFIAAYRNISYFCGATMLQTFFHKARKSAGILVLTAVFLSILASLSLPSVLELRDTDQEQVSLNLSEKDMKESYENQDPENEALEEMDLYQDYLLPATILHRDGAGCLFSFLSTHLSSTEVDIQLPPPQHIAA